MDDTRDPAGDAIGEPDGPPVAERRPSTIEAHGDARVDDWYWLRDKGDPSVMALLEAENAWTRRSTARLDPLVEAVYGEILSRTRLTDVTYPVPRGPYGYYTRTIDGLQYPVWCRRPRSAPPPDPDRLPAGVGEAGDGAEADVHETVVLDENALAAGHDYFEVGDRALSPDQRLLAYATDTTGGERMTVRVRDIAAGSDLPDVIEDAYYGLAFAADNETLFYTRPDAAMRPYQVWRHRLGTPWEGDEKVFEEGDERFFVGVGASKDDALVLLGAQSDVTSEWWYLDAAAPGSEPVLVEGRRQGVEYSVEHHRGELLILSNDGAENFALYRAPLSSPSKESWSVVLPERSDVRLEGMDVMAGHVLVQERGGATTSLRAVALDAGVGEDVTVEAPPAGTVSLAANLEFETTAFRYVTASLVDPPALHEMDLEDERDEVLWRLPVPSYDPGLYRTERRWATSSDGTKVPVTLAWRADRPAGPGPALLYGYGAYGLSSDPGFSVSRPVHPLLDRGVLYAIAHVRGGEELGRHWYLDGKLANKPNSFEDLLSAAHLLVDGGLTTPERLALHGASAGGLLVGATLNLDPGGFGAAVAEVPFVDCLTTMLDPSLPLTTTEWEEWGDPVSDPEAYRCIRSYSPYDNVKAVRYPRMLVTGGLSDPRVGHFEPAKWVQKLRAAHPDNPSRILLRMELSAGHFGPSGRFAAWRRYAFVVAFILDAVGAAPQEEEELEGVSVTS